MRLSLKQLLCVVVLCGTALAAVSISHEASSSQSPAKAAVRVADPIRVQVSHRTRPVAYFAIPDLNPFFRAVAYVTAIQADQIHKALVQIVEYVTAVKAEQDAEAAEAARQAEIARQRAQVRPQVSVGSGSGGGGGGACGGATNGADQFIHRESGGNPNVVNSTSGAYGCYQIMPYVWAATCSDLGPEQGSSPAAQAACASRLPLSAWNL